MQINLTGFLNGKNARLFMGELWELLLSAQASENGIPESFTQQKKEEIKKRMVSVLYFFLNIHYDIKTVDRRFIKIGGPLRTSFRLF